MIKGNRMYLIRIDNKPQRVYSNSTYARADTVNPPSPVIFDSVFRTILFIPTPIKKSMKTFLLLNSIFLKNGNIKRNIAEKWNKKAITDVAL